MPLDNERAHRLAHVSMARQDHIREQVQRWQTVATTERYADKIAALVRPVEDLGPGDRAMTHCLAIDGSLDEILLPDDSMVGFVVAAAALTDIAAFNGSRRGRLVDTRALAAATTRFSVETVVPSAFKAASGLSGIDSWRVAVDDMLALPVHDHATASFTLGSALRLLYGSTTAAVPLRGCADCGYQPAIDPAAAFAANGPLTTGSTLWVTDPATTGPSTCPACGVLLRLGDALHTHPEFNEEGENGKAMSRLMLIAERLMMVGHIEATMALDPTLLRDLLCVTDGPLAIFGSRSGSLAPKFGAYLSWVNARLSAQGLPPLQYVGIEKHGAFAEHAHLIRDHIAPGHLMLPDGPYIQRHIVKRVDDHNIYGAHEFYGRRFFYRTRAGDMLVLTVPPVPGVAAYSREEASHQWESYPTVASIARHLDSMRSRLYENAVLPLMTAHASASLPQGTGRSVLTALAHGARRDPGV
ncbi:hypothetical protein [Nocardioides sp. Leaf285]|uniref:hypothetical protein n=1 Tax=Nocardioides sp. Leaf285 TaxID=1736322 RepID=UPI000702CE2F|nr:hypothetical protein [Nocardioides sp. Leaf285]KQP62911.1 hypothetical protein ASF47_18025 [Nocardioides sp. Leaf285]